MTDKPARRLIDNEQYIEMIVNRTIEKSVPQAVMRFCTSLGIDVSTPESIIEVQKNWAFLTKSRKIASYLFMAGLAGSLTWLGNGLKKLPSLWS